MKQYLLGAGVAAIAIAVAAPASAVTFTTSAGLPTSPFLADFRGPGGDLGSPGPLAFGPVTAESVGGSSPANIFQDAVDGIGVISGEPDEVEGVEQLSIVTPALSTISFGITDLFDNAADGQPEVGAVTVTCQACAGTTTFFFQGGDSTDGGASSGNGEQTLTFTGLGSQQNQFDFFVPTLAFIAGIDQNFADSLNLTQDNIDKSEFSVAVVTPLPAAVWMFGAGLAGVAGAAYRRRNRAQAEA